MPDPPAPPANPGPSAPRSAPTVVTIGNFDGVHVGHQAIIQSARRYAESAGSRVRVVAAVFAEHPATVLRPGAAPKPLTIFERRAALLREAGADEIVPIHPTPDLLARAPEEFLETFFMEHRPACIVEGDDFRFGAARSGDLHTLRAFAEQRGVQVRIVEQVDVALTNQHLVRASSTITRWLLDRGRIEDAARVLGRPHRLHGVVVRGDRRGQEIGYPTANLETGALIPADGIYAGFATLDDGAVWPAAISVGVKPTFDGAERAVEAYLCGWDGPEGHEYGWGCALDLVAWIRGQARFASVASLVAQIDRDVDQILRTLGTLSDRTPRPELRPQAYA